jgi:hypothetical protein
MRLQSFPLFLMDQHIGKATEYTEVRDIRLFLQGVLPSSAEVGILFLVCT